ncbi:polymer-forming cytoskeletal protein [Ascidiaceihabitans sp.]|nr:polymer-forming cytoskeletal protein [Ascidiaceihabitans sp.]MDA9135817.1 polymer-forming cytoskeletal protein [Ascidiaceihabitans sp.]
MQKVFLTMFSKPVRPKSDVTAAILPDSTQRRSVLHDGIVIEGDWQSDSIVEFGGAITGDLTVDVLIVTSTGTVEGNVRARSVTVEGQLNGTIAAIDVNLSPTAIVRGEIKAERIQIDFGAQVEGRLTAKGEASS